MKQRSLAELAHQLLDVFLQPFALVIENQFRAGRGPRFRNRPRDAPLVRYSEYDADFSRQNLLRHNAVTIPGFRRPQNPSLCALFVSLSPAKMTPRMPNPEGQLNRLRGAFLERIEAGDGLLFLYTAVIIRQCLWWIPVPNSLAWGLAAIGAALVLLRYVTTKDELRGRKPVAFWVVVVVPLSFVYLLRLPFPDVSFDVLNYRLFHGIRTLDGCLYRPGDFFPTPAPYNTAPDMVMGITRILFGYRLGTIVNLLALIWSASILDRLFAQRLTNTWLRAGTVLLVLASEQLFFVINTYMMDLLVLPLLLEATQLSLRLSEAKNRTGQLTRIAFLLGVSVAFKLIYVVVAFPIVLICVWTFLVQPLTQNPARELGRPAFFFLIAFVAPMLPFSIYLYQQMDSAVFPMLNGIFRSPYWPANSGWDERWGLTGFWGTLTWPVRGFLRPERLSELNVYSGRLSIAAIGALLALILAPRDVKLRKLSFILLVGSFIWSAASGYIRYALFLELIGGTILGIARGERDQQKMAGRSCRGSAGFVRCASVAGLRLRRENRMERARDYFSVPRRLETRDPIPRTRPVPSPLQFQSEPDAVRSGRGLDREQHQDDRPRNSPQR